MIQTQRLGDRIRVSRRFSNFSRRAGLFVVWEKQAPGLPDAPGCVKLPIPGLKIRAEKKFLEILFSLLSILASVRYIRCKEGHNNSIAIDVSLFAVSFH